MAEQLWKKLYYSSCFPRRTRPTPTQKRLPEQSSSPSPELGPRPAPAKSGTVSQTEPASHATSPPPSTAQPQQPESNFSSTLTPDTALQDTRAISPESFLSHGDTQQSPMSNPESSQLQTTVGTMPLGSSPSIAPAWPSSPSRPTTLSETPSKASPQTQPISQTSSNFSEPSIYPPHMLPALQEYYKLTPLNLPSDAEYDLPASKSSEPEGLLSQQPAVQLQALNQSSQSDKNTRLPTISSQPAEAVSSIPTSADSLNKTSPAAPDALISPTQHKELEIKPGVINEKPIAELEQEQDMSPDTPKSEEIPKGAYGQKFYLGISKKEDQGSEGEKPASKPEIDQGGDAKQNPVPETKPEEIMHGNLNTKPEVSEKHLVTKLLGNGSDSKPAKYHSNSSQPIRMSGEELLEKQVQVHEKVPTQNGFARRKKVPTQNVFVKNHFKFSIPASVTASMSNEEQAIIEKEIEDDIMRLAQSLDSGYQMQPGNEHATSIITLAGENKGASMIIGRRNNCLMPILNRYDHNQGSTEVNANHCEKKNKEKFNDMLNLAQATSPSINSNTQGINNSIVKDYSCSEKNPGVHLVITSKHTKPIKLKEKMDSPLIYKVECSTAQAPQLTSQL